MTILPRRHPRTSSRLALGLVVCGVSLAFVAVAATARRSASLGLASGEPAIARVEKSFFRRPDACSLKGLVGGGAQDIDYVVTDMLQAYGKTSTTSAKHDPKKKKTKIVATVGPACSDLESLKQFLRAGANIFRLNASHRRPGQFERVTKLIRQASRETGIPAEILGDLQGPKFRVGEVGGDGSVMLKVGEEVSFGICRNDQDVIIDRRITMNPTQEQNSLMKGLKVGMRLLINDGAMELVVTRRRSETEVKAKVLVGGKLTACKGVNVPQLQIDCSALTTKDIQDAKYLLSVKPPIDYLALSFVQKKQDVQDLIDIMDKEGIPKAKRPKIIPKIEKPQALENINEIMELAQGVMVARGDLGVECGVERVPFAQKLLIRKANLQGKFVITATQMLESMNSNAAPTRAEVSDVSNAVFDGTDAVMTSAETSTGNFPIKTIQAMSSIVSEAEATLPKLAALSRAK